MTTRGEINSNFYQIVNVDGNGAPTEIKPQYIPAATTANYAAYAGNITINAQPNITSTGTLTGLTSNGIINFSNTSNVTLGDVSNLHIAGGSLGQVLRTDGLGNLSWVTGGGGGGVPGGSNTYVQFNDGGTFNGVAELTFNKTTNTLSATNIGGNGALLTNLTGGNVVGDVSGANHANVADTANSVSVSNVSGIGNIATINLDGNVSNILHGNGYWGPDVSGNANYAAYAGNVTVNAQPNITSLGTLTSLDVSGNAVIAGNLTGLDSLTFDTANVPGTIVAAQLAWNDGQGTLDLGLKGGNVIAKLAEQEYARVYNDEATTLNKGEIVYVYGAQGNLISVKRAQANAEATSNGTLGMVAETITAGGEGFVQVSGSIYKLNTNGLTAGGAIYLSPTVAGGYTQTKPVAPDNLVILGWVERVSTTVGSVYLKVDNGYELEELHNVLITSPVAGQALVYNSSNLWVNGNPANANTANTVIDAAQPNITSTGTLTGLTVSGLIVATGTGLKAANIQDPTGTITIVTQYAGNVGDVGVYGNLVVGTVGTGNVIVQGNITSGNASLGNLATANFFSGNGSLLTGVTTTPGGNTTQVQFNNAGVLAGTARFTYNDNTAQPSITLQPNTGVIGLVRMPQMNFTTASGTGNIGRSNAAGGTDSLFLNDANAITITAPTVNLGSNSNIKITGGSSSQVLSTDGLGNLSWASAGGATPAGTNTQIQFNNASAFGASANFIFNNTTNTVTVDNSNITNANITTATITTGNLTTLNVTGTANIANLTTNKYSENVQAGGSVSGTITPNVAAGTIFNYTLTGSITLNALGNAVAGSGCTLILTQGGSGSYTLTSTMKFAGGTKTLSTAVGAIDIVSVFYDGTIYYATLAKGFA